MEHNEDILNKIKSNIRDFYRLISIEKSSSVKDKYSITYICLEYYNNEPRFTIESELLDLKVEVRDSLIDFILKQNKEELSSFDVESIIYTEEQQKKLEELRNPEQQSFFTKLNKYDYRRLVEVKKEYSKSFEIGDPVHYNGHYGIITFKHQYKGGNQLWSVKVGDTEHRYVDGVLFRKRVIEDISNIPIDKELNKLSTERLLKMYKRTLKFNRGIGNSKIKRILNEREHVQKGETKIIKHLH